MLNIVLFGPPGAGKGTQSEKLIERYNLIHIATGDLFRKHIKQGSHLGQLAQQYMDEGNLVPDEVVIGMVDEKIKESPGSSGFLFDGFPRTVAQAVALDNLLYFKDNPIDTMISLKVDEDELKKRLLLRGLTSGRPDDQDESKIANRITVYNKETAPVADYYRKQAKFNEVYGVGSIDDIFTNLTKVIEHYL
jgi:adenylate kinase